MTNTVLCALPIDQAADNSGLPLGGGLLYTYQAASAIPLQTYADLAGTVLNSNPVILDSTGHCTVRYLPGTAYKLVLTDSTGSTILGSRDNFYPPLTDQASVGAVLYPQTAQEAAASVVPTVYSWPPGHFNRYGALGDNVTDDHAAVSAAFSTGHLVTGAAGSTYYCGTATITISGSKVKASLYGVALRTAVNGAAFLSVTGNNLEIRGAEIYGRGNSSYVSGEKLIEHTGTVSAYASGLRLVECYFHDVGAYAVYSEFGQRANIVNCHFKNIGYAAILYSSGLDVEVRGGWIDTVSPGTSGNAYGVSYTRITNISDDFAVRPRTKNCSVIGMLIKNITVWTALNTHAGEEILFEGNTVENCKYGVSIGACNGVAGTSLYGPKNCKSVGNQITGASGGGGFGVNITGAGTAVGTTIDAATGCSSVGDTVLQCGTPGSTTTGGFVFYYTSGLQVTGVTALNCYSNGIVFYHDNTGFVVSGGSVVDPHDPTNVCAGIRLDAGYNTGIVSGVSLLLVNAALDTHVADRGIYINTNTSTTLAVGPNYNTFTTPYSQLPAAFTYAALTDNSGGTPSDTIASQTGSYVQATQQNTIASLAAKINSIIASLHALGIKS